MRSCGWESRKTEYIIGVCFRNVGGVRSRDQEFPVKMLG